MTLNYKASIVHEMYNLIEEYPDWTMGQILHSFTRKSVLGKSLFETTDEELYTAIEKIKEYETDEQ